MHKLVISPDADGYGSTDGTEWLRSELDGGVGRYRKDKVGASKMVNARWTLNRDLYAYWRSFYALVGSMPFLCDLLSEDGTGPKEQVCNIVPGSVSLPSQLGLTYVQQCQLEVRPLPRNAALDLSRVLLYEQSSGNLDQWAATLAHITLVTVGKGKAYDA